MTKQKKLERKLLAIKRNIQAGIDISYDDLAFLQDHQKECLETGDSELCEFAGIPEETFHSNTKTI